MTKYLLFFIVVSAFVSLIEPALARNVRNNKQFNVICPVHARTVVDYRANLNQSPGTSAPAEWSDTYQYAVDLKQRRFVGLNWIEPKSRKIARVTNKRFWFSEDQEGFERYNLITNRYYARIKGPAWQIVYVTGRCRREPFSGPREG